MLVDLSLDFLGFCNVDVSFCCRIDHLLTHVSALSKLDFSRPEIWLNAKVYQTPVLEEGMKSDDAADVARQLLPALCG